MSDTYFCFSDECGDYKPRFTTKQLKIHPFYIRTTLLINASEWKLLNREFKAVKVKYGIPNSQEVKWAHLWGLRSFQKYNKPIPKGHELYPLRHYDYNLLINFVDEALSLISILKEKKIIATFTKNALESLAGEKAMLSFHLQEHMQRLEMELQVDEGNLGVLFFDPVGNSKNELFREIYYSLFENGDFIDKYKFIKDSLNIENSHHSVGIQIADYISGAFSSILKAHPDNNQYSRGITMFFQHVYPNLRRNSYTGAIHGYGIREVPRNKTIREWLVKQIAELEAK